MRPILLMAFVLFATATAQAQSFHLVQGDLRWHGVDIGYAERVPVDVQWQARRQVLMTFDGESARVQAEVRLRGLDGALLAGVGKPVILENTHGWKITMAGEAWAPVAGGSKNWTEIQLPREFPVRTGRVPASSPGAMGSPSNWMTPDVSDALLARYGWKRGDDPADSLSVDQTRIYRGPGDGHPWVRVGDDRRDDGIVVEVLPGGRWVKVVFVYAGFVVEGLARAKPGFQTGHIGLLPLGQVTGGVCDSMFGPGRWVWLDPGMSLFARPRSARSKAFSVMTKRTMAYQKIPPDLSLAAGAVPPTEFMLPIHQGDAHLLLTGYVNVPNGELQPVESAPGAGDGSCGGDYDRWPPPEY